MCRGRGGKRVGRREGKGHASTQGTGKNRQELADIQTEVIRLGHMRRNCGRESSGNHSIECPSLSHHKQQRESNTAGTPHRHARPACPRKGSKGKNLIHFLSCPKSHVPVCPALPCLPKFSSKKAWEALHAAMQNIWWW